MCVCVSLTPTGPALIRNHMAHRPVRLEGLMVRISNLSNRRCFIYTSDDPVRIFMMLRTQFDDFSFYPSLRSLQARDTLPRTKTDPAKCSRPSLHRESISFMKGVMDECTHMANFSGELSCTQVFLQTDLSLCIICHSMRRRSSLLSRPTLEIE